jgi:peptidoglycan biosynthesis protein MviN/MurJ (putative lipid II flippase)
VARVFVRLLFGGMVGKVLGLIREVLLAALYGAGRVVAANRIAQTATLVPINFFTADALSAGFLPLYVEYQKSQSALASSLYRTVRNILAMLSLALLGGLIVSAGMWVRLLAPGLDPSTSSLAASMLVVTALGVPCYIQYNLYTLLALANDDTRLINIRASMQSVGLIAATVAAFYTGHVQLLAWGFTAPYVALFGWGAYWVRRHGHLPRHGRRVGAHRADARGATDTATVRPDRRQYRIAAAMFWRRMRPLLIVPVVLQGSIAVERMVCSLLGVDVVAASEYARFIVDSIMALVAAPLGLASLAAFAKLDAHEIGAALRRLVPPILLVTVPMSLVLCIDRTGIVDLMYGRGHFDSQAVAVTSTMMLGFAVGVWAQVAGYMLVKVLNARGANLSATFVTVASFGSGIAVNLLFYRHWGPLTIGIAASVAGVVMFVASAVALGILRYCAAFLALLGPGVLLAGAVGALLAGRSLPSLITSAAAMAAVLAVYIAAVPRLRDLFRISILARLRRPRAAPERARAVVETAVERG